MYAAPVNKRAMFQSYFKSYNFPQQCIYKNSISQRKWPRSQIKELIPVIKEQEHSDLISDIGRFYAAEYFVCLHWL